MKNKTLIMKIRLFILSIIATIGFGFNTECLPAGQAGSGQPVIITDSIFQTSFCAGSNVFIPFTVIDTGGSFNFGNIFTAQLSDEWGDFSNPVDIGTVPIPWTISGFILGTIPINSPLFGIYKVRVVGSNPTITGSESPNFIIIINTAQLAAITAADTIICDGNSTVLTATPFFQSYQWSRNTNSITGATTPSITVYQAGSYTVTVRDTLGCETTSDPKEVIVEICTGISENNNQNSVSIYPNPNTGQFTLTLPSNQLNSSFILYDLPGKEIIHIREMKETKIKISVNNIPDGIYIYNVINGYNIIGTGKLIINKK